MDIYSDSNENAIKINDEPTSEDDRPPRLPPRPPPRPRNTMNSEAGMIYSCRFFCSRAKWCPITRVNWKSFPCAALYVSCSFTSQWEENLNSSKECRARELGEMWIEKVFHIMPLNDTIWKHDVLFFSNIRKRSSAEKEILHLNEFLSLCEEQWKKGLEARKKSSTSYTLSWSCEASNGQMGSTLEQLMLYEHGICEARNIRDLRLSKLFYVLITYLWNIKLALAFIDFLVFHNFSMISLRWRFQDFYHVHSNRNYFKQSEMFLKYLCNLPNTFFYQFN